MPALPCPSLPAGKWVHEGIGLTSLCTPSSHERRSAPVCLVATSQSEPACFLVLPSGPACAGAGMLAWLVDTDPPTPSHSLMCRA